MREVIERRLLDEIRLEAAEVAALVEAARRSADSTAVAPDATVAVIPIQGMLTHRARLVRRGLSVGEATSTEDVEQQLMAAANDPRVQRIILDIDSPGGSVEGVPELAALIRQVRARVPVTAVANSTAASAAYWLASQASELVATPSATVGSIGVYAIHEDRSAELEQQGRRVTLIAAGPRKLDGHPYGPLPEDVRARIQARVDATYRQFLADVAMGRGRGLRPEDVERNYGGGDVLTAQEALEAGAVDRIGTLREVLQEATARPAALQPGRAASLDLRRRRLALAALRARM